MKSELSASSNFEIAKVFAILTVATAHFFPNTLLWVPSSIALFVFGFSSSYFTHLKYRTSFQLAPYWMNKILRLGYSLLIIDVFLLIVCAARSSQTIWVWQTLPHLAGLGGFLGWFGISNPSPLGNGMWFFTLLLVFYAAYPVLRRIMNGSFSSWALLFVSGVALSICHFRYPVGYDLWLTAVSFIFGMFVAERTIQISSTACLLGGSASILLMGAENFLLRDNSYNFFLIMASSIFLTLWLLVVSLPEWLSRLTKYFSDILLEIYLIHTYLFISFTGLRMADYVLSLCLIVITARGLHMLTPPGNSRPRVSSTTSR